MTSRCAIFVGLCASVALSLLLVVGNPLAVRPDKPSKPAGNRQFRAAYTQLPMIFEANHGQSDSQVQFLSHGSGYTLFLTSTEAVLALQKSSRRESSPIRMQFAGANPTSQVTGLDMLEGKSHYFVGHDPKRWRTNIPHHARVQYRQVYPGVDLVFYGNQGRLEYDWMMAPGADLERIRLRFEGVDHLSLDGEGDLILHTPGGEVVQRAPAIYQEVEGVRKTISGGYVLQGQREVGFQTGPFDASKPLVLDPVLEYSSFFGGSKEDEIISVAVDQAGNAYLTGETSSPDLPTTPGALPHPDAVFRSSTPGSTLAFVAKLNATGSALVYCTYLGGSKISVGHDIAVDAAGNAYVAGRTQASDFPLAKPLQSAFGGGSDDAFVSKLHPAGSTLVYSTYLGGSEYDQVRSLAVDSAGNAYLTGHTRSTNFPTVRPLQAAFGGGSDDAFVAKLNAAGSALTYSTYLGGGGADTGHAVTVDASGNAYITGLSNSPNFPTAKPFQASFRGEGNDTIVVKLNASGSALVYSTYLGGSKNDESRGIAVDASGNVYVTGYTQSPDFPTMKPFQGKFGGGSNDAFITKLNPQGSVVLYSTFLGGSGGDFGRGIALDPHGNIYLTGYTESKDFPTVNPIQAAFAGGSADAFVAKLNAAGSALTYSSYLGGEAYERGRGIAVDRSGNVYISGRTESKNFPLSKPFRKTFGGGPNDAFVAKISGEK